MSRSKLFAVTYLVMLAFSVLAGWYVAASDLVSLYVSDTQLLNEFGAKTHHFAVGSEVKVQHYYCASGHFEFHYYPALMDTSGTLFPLTSGALVPHMGCKTMSYGFFVPALPPGKYTLLNTINYQNGMLNDVLSFTLPATSLEIVP